MFSYYVTIGLVHFLIGFFMAYLYYYILKKEFLGNFFVVLIVALIASFLGALFDYFFGNILDKLTNLFGSVNIFPPFITVAIVLTIYAKISNK